MKLMLSYMWKQLALFQSFIGICSLGAGMLIGPALVIISPWITHSPAINTCVFLLGMVLSLNLITVWKEGKK